MGVLSSTKRDVYYFDQGFKCFVRHLAW